MIEQIPETWRKTKDSDGVIRIWSNRVTHVVAHVLECPEQDAVADLIVAAPETAWQRNELRAACQEVVTAYRDLKVHATWLEAVRDAIANVEAADAED